ncbi:MAG: cytochrome c family protein [Planctomycetes bacterium]|nr:cytochrome c family protein [Planctomycetota bacterium]
MTAGIQEEKCGGCHQQAFAHWSKTRHASSMATLRSHLKQGDLRCLPCHAQEYSAGPTGGATTAGTDAITCISCHNRSGSPSEVCRTCHTSITDPFNHYSNHSHTICSGGSESPSAGRCSRP